MTNHPKVSCRHSEAGAAMIELLVALVIAVFGVLGLIGMQLMAYAAESESYQRSQALILLEDMVQRVNSNRANVAAYVKDDVGVGAVEAGCDAKPSMVERDLCNWGNLLRGAAELTEGADKVGAMASARACITSPEANVVVIAVVWLGVNPTAAPTTLCGKDQYGNEALRRAVTTRVRIATLGV